MTLSPSPVLRSWLFVLVALVLVMVSSVAVVYSSYETRRLVASHQRLQQENNAMQVEWGQLLLEQSTWGSYNRVEQLAGTKLKMRVPAPNEIVMVEP
ncbi:MAG: cell division protein FtsL [Pseudomonadales bacterium]|mgnify:CR=1 FL=1|jgi:cell division protein FtsL|uniref:cell division protein FtsL n=1 Tax=unclassified Ketobacter TaxID=2639109 RepID=UPI000C5FFEB2|nr:MULTISPECIES: cell division protein FtsL [unclassified Ketobacter]MAA59754.1 cell division protein FtsL [Pseudomonadales bacterium]TNC85300.1 MAG: cell division protein FtsL [Alcanivorax sp.]HAG95746.1 cell division protein FtsL [Gammaproteobacteria bacterium]MAQ25362.1 cell division protein FtsL [Pseudomonadales bacterium]MBI25920.1 cell division protein FtsL [Pseudomonadales bacterium]|tara:strand:+ start:257 stop:547 length:291 start_codon:yes stop_codon:yes gene_type:complete